MLCTFWGGSTGIARGGRRGACGVVGGGLRWTRDAGDEEDSLVRNDWGVSAWSPAGGADPEGGDPEGDAVAGGWRTRIPLRIRTGFYVDGEDVCESVGNCRGW
jgi:hypothetical protein